jgi:hypothetical protein
MIFHAELARCDEQSCVGIASQTLRQILGGAMNHRNSNPTCNPKHLRRVREEGGLVNHFSQGGESRDGTHDPFLEFLDQNRAAFGHQELAQALARWVRLVTTRRDGRWTRHRSGAPENQAGSTGTDQRNLRIDQLIRRSATELPHGFGGQVQAVDVALADQATVGVAGKTAPQS